MFKSFALLLTLQFLPSLVELDGFAELLEEFEHVIAALRSDCPLEHALQQRIIDLDVGGVVRQGDKAFGVFFVAFAALQEHYEVFESASLYGVPICNHGLQCLAQIDRVLLVDAQCHEVVNQIPRNILLQLSRGLAFICLLDMSYDFFKMLFLRVQSHCLQQ